MKKYVIPEAEIVKVKAEAQLTDMWSGHTYIPGGNSGDKPQSDIPSDDESESKENT